MGRVDQFFQIIGVSVAATSSIEAVDLVSEAGVVRMLHDSHELDDIVSQMLDSRQDVGRELLVGRNLGLGRRDANVCLVDACACGLRWFRMLEDILLVLGRVPKSGIVDGGDGELLCDACNPCGDALLPRMVIWNNQ